MFCQGELLYQQELVDKVLQRLSLHDQAHLCLQLPTGAGKTAVVAAIIKAFGTSAWFIVPRKQLNAQAYTTFRAFNIPCGVINDTFKDWETPVCVCTLQTLQRHLSAVERAFPRLVVFDEAHIATDAHAELVRLKPCAVLGVTATPERIGADGLKGIPLSRLYRDGLICGPSLSYLQNKGYLAPLTYCKTQLLSKEEIKINAQDRIDTDTATAIEKRFGDVVGEYAQYGIGRPTIAFTPRIAMAESLAQAFSARGYAFEAISGKDPQGERNRKLRALTNHDLLGLCTADLLTYGVDLPQVSYIIDLRPTKSIALWYQMVGRGLRTCKGKTDCIFSDHVSQHELLGVKIGAEYYPPFILEDYETEWDFDGTKHRKPCLTAGKVRSSCKKHKNCLKLPDCFFWTRKEHESSLPCEHTEIIRNMDEPALEMRKRCFQEGKCLAFQECPYKTDKAAASLTFTDQLVFCPIHI